MVAVIVALLAARVHAVAQVTADLRFKDLGSPDLSWAPPTPAIDIHFRSCSSGHWALILWALIAP